MIGPVDERSLTPETGLLVQVGKESQQPTWWRVKAMSKQCACDCTPCKSQLSLEAADGLKAISAGTVEAESVRLGISLTHPFGEGCWLRVGKGVLNFLFVRIGDSLLQGFSDKPLIRDAPCPGFFFHRFQEGSGQLHIDARRLFLEFDLHLAGCAKDHIRRLAVLTKPSASLLLLKLGIFFFIMITFLLTRSSSFFG